MKVGIIVGRFQTPFLHDGHLNMVKRVLDECDLVVIVIGGDDGAVPNEKNPFSFAFRRELLEYQLQNYSNKLIYTEIIDCDSDVRWNAKLNVIANKYWVMEGCDVALFGSRDSFLKTYEGPHKTKELEVEVEMSATEIRQKYLKILE